MNIKSISKLWVKLDEANAPTIRTVIGQKVDAVRITIFDTFGHMVHEKMIQGLPAGEFNGELYYDYTWAEPKSRGIYTAVIDSEAKGEKLTGKTTFAVMGGHHENHDII